jgi:uncharacterized protein with GYD domain
MATYISLLRYTHQGVTSIKEGPGRVDAAHKVYAELGAELKAVYFVMGRYDFVAIVEAPDEVTAARAALALGSKGNVSSETLRAFTQDEFRSIVAGLP